MERGWVAKALALVLLAAATIGVILLTRTAEPRLAWTQVPAAGIPNGAALTSLSCPAPDECWAAGTVSRAPGRAILAHLHGGEWTVVDLDQVTSVSCRAVDDCWGASATASVAGVRHYDGTQWTLVDPEYDEGRRALVPAGAMTCQLGGTCVATAAGGTGCERRPAVWDGQSWRPTPVNTAECLRTVACAAADRCDGFGLTGGDGPPAPVVFRIDGDHWQPATEPARREYLRTSAVSSCPAAGDCLVLYSAALNRYRPWAELGLLDGGTWRDPAAANDGLPESLYAMGIACTSLSHCLLAGADAPMDTAAMYQWDGTQWTSAPLPDFGAGTALNAVACPAPETCWAIGTDSAGDTVLVRGRPI